MKPVDEVTEIYAAPAACFDQSHKVVSFVDYSQLAEHCQKLENFLVEQGFVLKELYL